MVSSSCLSRDGRAIRLVANEAPDVLTQSLELRIGARRVVAWPRQRDIDQSLEAAWMRGHHGHAVGEEHRLVDGVRDEHDGAPLRSAAVLAPDAQQLVLQDQARLRV